MADWHPSDLGAKVYAFWDFADSAKITASGGVVSSVALSYGTVGTLDLLPGVDGGTVFNPTTDATTFGGIPSLVIGPNKNLKAVVDLGTTTGLTAYVGLKSSTANFRSKLASFSQSTWDDSEPDSFGMHQHGDGVSSNSVEFYRDMFGGSKTPSNNIVSTETFSSIFFAGGGGICRATGKGSNFNTNAAVAFNGSTRFAIGANANADWADHLPSGCYVSFALICLAELTPDEREKLDAWDAWRRGYQSKVRNTSPYALAKPTTADPYLVSLAVTQPYVNNANWQGYTIRQVYPASMLALSGSSIKLSFPPQNINISKCYIGHRSGSTLNFDGTPAQVLFGGSPSASLTVAGGVALFSDATTFALDETKDIIIAVYFNSTGQSDILQADHDRTGVIRAYTNSPVDDAANVTAGSYNTGTTREALVDHIMVATPSTGPTGTAAQTTAPASLTAAGQAKATGTEAQTTAAASLAAAGVGRATGARSASTQGAALAALGGSKATGQAAATTSPATAAAQGIGRATGTHSETTTAPAMVAAGSAALGTLVGTRTATTDAPGMVAAGTTRAVGTATQAAPAPAMAAAGVSRADGYKNSLTNAPALAATGAARADGTTARTTAPAALDAAGYTITAPAQGQAAQTTTAPTLAATGQAAATSNVVMFTAAPALSATGSAQATGASEQTTTEPARVATAVIFGIGNAAQITNAATNSAVGATKANGNSAQVTSAATMTARGRSTKVTGVAALMLGV